MKKRTLALIMAFLCVAIVLTPTIILLEPSGKFLWELLFVKAWGIPLWIFCLFFLLALAAGIYVFHKRKKGKR